MRRAGTWRPKILSLLEPAATSDAKSKGLRCYPLPPALQPCKQGLSPCPSSMKISRLERWRGHGRSVSRSRGNGQCCSFGLSRGQPFAKVTGTIA